MDGREAALVKVVEVVSRWDEEPLEDLLAVVGAAGTVPGKDFLIDAARRARQILGKEGGTAWLGQRTCSSS